MCYYQQAQAKEKEEFQVILKRQQRIECSKQKEISKICQK